MFKSHTSPAKTTTDEKLQQIVQHLERMDKRDRLRTYGGFVRSILGLIPLAILLGTVWYGYNHADDLLQKITEQAAKQAAAITTGNTNKMINSFFKK